MNFIKIGGVYINLDNVTDINDTEDGMHIYFNTPRGSFGEGEGRIEQEHSTIAGENADILRWWLNRSVPDIVSIRKDYSN